MSSRLKALQEYPHELKNAAFHINIVTGDDTGLIKFSDISLNANKSIPTKQVAVGKQSKQAGIKFLRWAGALDSPESASFPREVNADFIADFSSHRCPYCSHLLAANQSGQILLHANPLLNPAEGSVEPTVLNTFEGKSLSGLEIIGNEDQDALRFLTTTLDGNMIVSSLPGHTSPVVSQWKIGDNSSCVTLDHAAVSAISAGKEHLPKIWDITTQQCSFAAKSQPADMVGLRDRVWVNALQFMHATSHIFVSATAYGALRVYDTRAQRKAVLDYQTTDIALTALTTQGLPEYQCLAGDGRGTLQLYDLRYYQRPSAASSSSSSSPASSSSSSSVSDSQSPSDSSSSSAAAQLPKEGASRVLSGYRGIGGGVRGVLVCSPSNNPALLGLDGEGTRKATKYARKHGLTDRSLVVSVSLDRHLRIHDMHTKHILHKAFLKQQLTAVLECTSAPGPLGAPSGAASDSGSLENAELMDDDSLWSTLEAKRHRKRLLTEPAAEAPAPSEDESPEPPARTAVTAAKRRKAAKKTDE